MTIDQFVELYRKRLSEFREEWIRGHRADHDIYPEELDSSSEWIEQFFIWIDDYD